MIIETNFNTFLCHTKCMKAVWGVDTLHCESNKRAKKELAPRLAHSFTHGRTCTMRAGMQHQRLTLACFALWHSDLAVEITELWLEGKIEKVC